MLEVTDEKQLTKWFSLQMMEGLGQALNIITTILIYV